MNIKSMHILRALHHATAPMTFRSQRLNSSNISVLQWSLWKGDDRQSVTKTFVVQATIEFFRPT